MKNKISWYYKKIRFILKNKINLDKKIVKYNSLNDLFNYFGSDKGTSVINPYSKNSKQIIGHGFGKFYEKYFEIIKNQEINLLEIGVWEGSSIAAFNKYMPNANIFGIDRNFKFKYKSKKVFFFNCNTEKNNDLNNFKKKTSKNKFNIIIDDGSHLLKDIISNLKFFYNLLEANGYYAIEDFNHPEYYKYLNNSNKDELLFKDIIKNIQNKTFFKSKILSKIDQKYLFENIKEINTFKGEMIDDEKNVSDIVFFKK